VATVKTKQFEFGELRGGFGNFWRASRTEHATESMNCKVLPLEAIISQPRY